VTIDDATQFGTFDFGLSPDQETRARRLHDESIVLDMLFAGPCTYHSFTADIEAQFHAIAVANLPHSVSRPAAHYLPISMAIRGEFPAYKECWDASGVTAGSRPIDGFTDLQSFATWSSIRVAEFDHLPWLVKVLCAEDVWRAKREGKHGAWINTELVLPVDTNLVDLLKPAYDVGLRVLQLTYNSKTVVGSGCTELTDEGLTPFGAEVVAELNRLGIIVDTSHCSYRTTLEACALSTAPVIASHSSAKAVYHHARGKSDEELRAIAGTGGIIGVNAIPFFLQGGEGVTIEAMLHHVEYIANLVGWRHVGIGTDWPLALPKTIIEAAIIPMAGEIGFRPEDRITSENLIGFDDYRDFPNITRGLVKRGYSDEQIKGILGKNFLRIFATVCGK
jgi:membrane dipeptidase